MIERFQMEITTEKVRKTVLDLHEIQQVVGAEKASGEHSLGHLGGRRYPFVALLNHLFFIYHQ